MKNDKAKKAITEISKLKCLCCLCEPLKTQMLQEADEIAALRIVKNYDGFQCGIVQVMKRLAYEAMDGSYSNKNGLEVLKEDKNEK